MKGWRNKNSHGDKMQSNDNNNPNKIDPAFANENIDGNNPFPQHQQHKSIQSPMNDETFSVSVYILLVLTLAVILLFLNCYRKGRNNIRTRRTYFLLNKLGL